MNPSNFIFCKRSFWYDTLKNSFTVLFIADVAYAFFAFFATSPLRIFFASTWLEHNPLYYDIHNIHIFQVEKRRPPKQKSCVKCISCAYLSLSFSQVCCDLRDLVSRRKTYCNLGFICVHKMKPITEKCFVYLIRDWIDKLCNVKRWNKKFA